MLRFFLFMVGVMAVGTSTAGEVSLCADTVPIQIIDSGIGGVEIETSVDRIADPRFRAFVTTVTKHINSQLAKDKLCINSDKNMKRAELDRRGLCRNNAKDLECMVSAELWNRSLLQFVEWDLTVRHEYLVPVMISIGGRPPPSCQISSPWMDLVVYRQPVPSIRGIVRWNERQMLADQAVLAGAKNVPTGVAMPLSPSELSYFVDEIRRKSAAKPIEERVPPDILWLLHSLVGKEYVADAMDPVRFSMYGVTKNGAAGYTKLVLALIDRCFAADVASDGTQWKNLHYTNILDVADPGLLEQYRIDRSIHH